MAESKWEQNFQKEIGFGLQFGYYQDIINIAHGQLVVKLILWKVEEMLAIQNQLVEDLKLLDQPYIGDLIGPLINGVKLMLKNQ